MKVLRVTVVGQPALEKAATGLAGALDAVQILDEGSAVIYNRLRTRFLMEQAPDGTKWPKSRAAERRARTGRGGGTLFETGRLFRSLQLSAEGPLSRSIGTNVTSRTGFPYAHKHNFGIGFPRRQFLGFGEEDLDLMSKVIIRRIVQAFKQAKTP
jgi:phage gpG-like protein